ncbi:MAG: hypothetical protein M1839_008125 [Geoglossum umbratile]|nr:MAG: hypothetical protein M1839_008125 [Geoglossum umbratile]
MAPTQASQDPKQLLEESIGQATGQATGQAKPDPTSSTRAESAKEPVKSTLKEGESLSKGDDSKLLTDEGTEQKISPEEVLEQQLRDEQADRVADVLSQLDWNRKHRAPKPGFEPFYFFCTSVSSEKLGLKQILSSLKGTAASRVIEGGTETGQAWQFKDENLAKDLKGKVEQQVPELYLGYDLVFMGDGKPQSCKVVCTH